MTMKPMLAGTVEDVNDLTFPLYASPKLDGIRALCDMGDVLSRSLKMIPNKHIQRVLKDIRLHGLDGELIVGEPTAPEVMQKTSSGVMSREGLPIFTYYVFDLWDRPDEPFAKRHASLLEKGREFYLNGWGNFQVVPQVLVTSLADLATYEQERLEDGYEGVILRHTHGLYKYGRSTLSQGYLLKLKQFVDDEMVVTGFEPKLHNTNEQTRDERGYAKRSSHKENMVVLDTMGVMLGTDLKTGKPVRVGSGFSDELRKHIWENKPKYMKRIVTYKHFPRGVKDLVRFAVFKAFRDKRDMS